MDTLVLVGRVVVSLGVVLAVIWFAQRRVTRRTSARRAKDVVVVSRTGIGSKASVVSLEAGGRRFLLGVTDHSVQVLHAEQIPASAAVQPLKALREPDLEFDDFERMLADAVAVEPDHAEPAELTRRSSRARNSPPDHPLGGSILSPATWKQASAFMRQRQ